MQYSIAHAETNLTNSNDGTIFGYGKHVAISNPTGIRSRPVAFKTINQRCNDSAKAWPAMLVTLLQHGGTEATDKTDWRVTRLSEEIALEVDGPACHQNTTRLGGIRTHPP